MTTKLVLRLLDADGQLLGWTQLQGVAKGDGCLRVESVVITPTVGGTGSEVVIHWPDVHIQKRLPIDPLPVVRGKAVNFGELNWVLPTDSGPLPAVTVGATEIVVPTGSVGARGN